MIDRSMPALDVPQDPGRQAARLFWVCAIVYFLAWVIVPALTTPNILTDAVEGYFWGHEWPLGTYKHPPLAAWILESFAVVGRRCPWAHFVASQLSVLTAFWAVWQLSRRFLSETSALLATFLLVGVAYYNILIPEFNPNVLQLPLWALIGFFYYRGVKDGAVRDWILLGLFSALGLYAKYSTGLLLGCLGVLTLAHPEPRGRLRSAGPWLGLLVAVVLVAPHVAWLVSHNFLPFTYAEDRFERAGSVLGGPISLIVLQGAALLPAAVIYLIAFGRQRGTGHSSIRYFDALFLHVVAFGPFFVALLVAAAFGVKIRAMWGTPFWNFIGLWAVYNLRPLFTTENVHRFVYSWFCVFTIGLAGFAGLQFFEPYVTGRAGRIYFPGPSIGQQIDRQWGKRFHTPLRYVIGDSWVAGNVGFYAPDRPHVLINGDFKISPWIDRDKLTQDGAVLVWCRGDCTHQSDEDIPQWFWTDYPQAERQPVLIVGQQTDANVPPVKIGWAILPPAQ